MTTATPTSKPSSPSSPPSWLEQFARLSLQRWPEQARAAAGLAPGRKGPKDYPTDPVGYARDILGIRTLTDEQKAILEHLLIPPFKVLVPSAHDVGKTFAAAVAANWWYDSFDPGVVISTAPTEKDVKQLLWSEIRMQRQRAGLSLDFIGPAAAAMRSSEEHWAVGYTARKGESFQGRHRRRMLFIFDEANGIEPIYWQGTRSMFDPSLGHAWLSIYNPTTTTTQAYLEANSADPDGTPRWHLFRLSAADHPNLLAELEGRPKPVPAAVSLAMFGEWLAEWCEPVAPADRKATDFAWPPLEWCARHGREPKWYRPGPIFQARALGLDPDAGDGVWSPPLWEACVRGPAPPFPLAELPQLGIDTATGKGEDYVGLHGRWGAVSVLHETSNTMDAARIFGRARECCAELASLANRHRPAGAAPVDPRQIPVKIDDDGTGNAVCAFLRREGFAVVAVGAGTRALQPDRYPRKRDELWFQLAEKARQGGVYLGGLDRAALRRMRQQLLAVAWEMDASGRRAVEPKDKTREKIGRSPDDADCFNLSHYEPAALAPEGVEPEAAHGGESGHFGRDRRFRRGG